MKTSRISIFVFMGSLLLGANAVAADRPAVRKGADTSALAVRKTFPLTATVPNARDPAAALQLTIDVPPNMRPWVSDQIAEAFAARVADVLQNQGFKAGIHYVDSFATVVPAQPLLAIRLIEWRADHVGNVDCTFAATLTTTTGTNHLGLFTGTSILVSSRRDWFARSDQFDDAARQAISDLYRRIVETRQSLS